MPHTITSAQLKKAYEDLDALASRDQVAIIKPILDKIYASSKPFSATYVISLKDIKTIYNEVKSCSYATKIEKMFPSALKFSAYDRLYKFDSKKASESKLTFGLGRASSGQGFPFVVGLGLATEKAEYKCLAVDSNDYDVIVHKYGAEPPKDPVTGAPIMLTCAHGYTAIAFVKKVKKEED